MQGKTVRESAVSTATVMSPQDVNLSGNVFGGVIMKLIDTVAASVAVKHSRANAVTASIDRLDFHTAVFPGDLVTCKASLNYVGRTSMEIGVRVEAENLFTGEIRHTASSYLTFVALDMSGKPTELPPLIPETDEEKRRNRDAAVRREDRLRQRQAKAKNKNQENKQE
jgi:acyl-CoA hydrolase